MKDFLQELSKNNICLVAGSFARGTQTANSDIDFHIKETKQCKLYGGRNENVDKVIALLKKYSIKWNSTRTGYISTINSENDLPIQMEFYEGFYPNKDRQREVEIMGVKFKTR